MHSINELKAINEKYMSKKQLESFLFYSNTIGLLEREDVSKKTFDVFKIKKSLFCPTKVIHEGKLLNFIKTFIILGSITSLIFLSWFVSSRISFIFQALFTNNYLHTITIAYYFISIGIIGFFHEMGHAVMLVASGGNVLNLVMLNYFHPGCPVDITGIDMIKISKRGSVAWGIMAQLIIALPAMVLTFYDKSPLYLNEFMIIYN